MKHAQNFTVFICASLDLAQNQSFFVTHLVQKKMSKSDMYSKKNAYFLCSNESLHQSSSRSVCSLIGTFSLMRGV